MKFVLANTINMGRFMLFNYCHGLSTLGLFFYNLVIIDSFLCKLDIVKSDFCFCIYVYLMISTGN